MIKIEGIYDTIFPIQNLIINMPISVYHKRKGDEDNEYSLLNSKEDMNLNEKKKDELTDKSKLNKEENMEKRE